MQPGGPHADQLSLEVLASYELAEIARIGEGYDVGLPLRANAA